MTTTHVKVRQTSDPRWTRKVWAIIPVGSDVAVATYATKSGALKRCESEGWEATR
jgi:hypothetical protein